MKNLKTLAIICIAALVSSFQMESVTEVPNGPSNTTVTDISVDGRQFFIPCTGEIVTVSGYLRAITTIITNGNQMNVHVLYNPNGVTGISSSGKHYTGIGNNQQHFVGSPAGQSMTLLLNNFGMIGQGQAANLTGHIVLLLTVNANNVEKAEVEFENIQCR